MKQRTQTGHVSLMLLIVVHISAPKTRKAVSSWSVYCWKSSRSSKVFDSNKQAMRSLSIALFRSKAMTEIPNLHLAPRQVPIPYFRLTLQRWLVNLQPFLSALLVQARHRLNASFLSWSRWSSHRCQMFITFVTSMDAWKCTTPQKQKTKKKPSTNQIM